MMASMREEARVSKEQEKILWEAIEQIVLRCAQVGITLNVAEEADLLEPQFPMIGKRLICDMLIAAALAENLPIEMLDTEESCRDPDRHSDSTAA